MLGSLRSRESQRGYRHSIDEFITWYCSEPRLSFNKTVVTRYRIHLEDRQLAPGTINVRLVAVRRLAYEAADSGLVSPDLAAGIHRVKGAKKLGICRAGTIWGDGMTERIVWHVVKGVCWQAQPRRACPHDLRRSCARLCHAAGGEIEQIQFLLGHVSVQTTERYPECKPRLRGAVNDRIGVEP